MDFDLDGTKMPYPHYRCPVDGEALPMTEARITVTCARHQPESDVLEWAVRTAGAADRAQVEEICDHAWGETEVDAFGTTFDVLRCDNVLAELDGELAGLISLAVHGGDLAVVLLSVYPEHQGRGLGSVLLDTAVARAQERRLPSVKAAVDNDDIASFYFFQRHGFALYDVAIGAVADRHGSSPAGFACIPIRDELRLRRPIAP
jgi:ribosomal protein S18 acetylase RimI-like enzyme